MGGGACLSRFLAIVFVAGANAEFTPAHQGGLLSETLTTPAESTRGEINLDQVEQYLGHQVGHSSYRISGQEAHLQNVPTHPEMLSTSHQPHEEAWTEPNVVLPSPSPHGEIQTTGSSPQTAENPSSDQGYPKATDNRRPELFPDGYEDNHVSAAPRKRQRLLKSFRRVENPDVNSLTKISPQAVISAIVNDRLSHVFGNDRQPCSANFQIGPGGSINHVLSSELSRPKEHSKSMPNSQDFLSQSWAVLLNQLETQQHTHGPKLKRQIPSSLEDDSGIQDSSLRTQASGVVSPWSYQNFVQQSHEFSNGSYQKMQANTIFGNVEGLDGYRNFIDTTRQAVEPKSIGNHFAKNIHQPNRKPLSLSSGADNSSGSSNLPISETTSNKYNIQYDHDVTNAHQPKLPKVSFDKEIFNCGNGQGENPTHCQRILELIETKKEGRLVMKPHEIAHPDRILRGVGYSTKGTKLPGTANRLNESRYKRKEFWQNEDIWYTYWKDQTTIDFDRYCQQNMRSKTHRTIFPIFLFYVEMITTIIPRTASQVGYQEELESAAIFFAESAAKAWHEAVEKERKCPKKYRWKNVGKIDLLAGGDHYGPAALWIFLEPWIKTYYTELWYEMSRSTWKKDDDAPTHVKKSAKGVISNFFSYSISGLTERYRRLIDQISLNDGL